jgi:hypothetical protein
MNNKTLITEPNPFEDSKSLSLPSTGMANAESTRAMAEIQSAMVIAKKFPRDEKTAVDKILNECTRPGLAEQATYQYARGGTNIFGASIRLAETISRNWGNFQAGLVELSRSNDASEVMAYAMDLETNAKESVVFHVKHWRDTRSGGYALTDGRDIYELIANQGARRKRACILALIPGDVVDAALKQCDHTLRTKVDVTPETIKSLVEKFGQFKVTKEMIEARIQRRMDSMTPALMVNLGKIYTSLMDGMSNAVDWFDMDEAVTDLDDTASGDKSKAKEAKSNAGTPAMTAMDVIKQIKKAKDLEVLAISGDLLRELPDDDRAAAQIEYDKREKELTPPE